MIDYPVSLYEQTRPVIQASAAAVVPLLVDLFEPETVYDVGCGEGWWMAEFDRLGCDVWGTDGPHVDPPAGGFTARDLEQRLAADRVDLAISLEVAEHLSPSRADSFVADLCQLAPIVVFSAAVPGQGGAGHLNEQWPAYWARRFAEHGYAGSGALRWGIWDDDRIAPWYRQNLLVFGDLRGLAEDGCPPIVHPEIWGWYR